MKRKITKRKTKKTVKKKAVGKSAGKIKPIGKVTHYYNHIGVAIVKFNKAVKKGEEISVKGAHTDFTQTIDSMQYEHKDIVKAKKGQEVGIKVKKKVREGDKIYPVS